MPECPTCGSDYSSDHGVKIHHSRVHGEKYHAAIIRQRYDEEPADFLKRCFREEKRSLSSVADSIGCSTGTVQNMADEYGVETLSYSEAQKARWDGLDEEGRQRLLESAHETTREMVEKGEHNFLDPDFERVLTEEFKEEMGEEPDALLEWVENNPEKVREYAALGAEGRETNGMAGATGQDNPNWRGGKSVYDAVKKQLHGRSWTYLKEHERGSECYNCGETDSQHDLHHIVPIMSGGTNDPWNLMTLCDSCHRKAELYVRQLPEFDPVLVE